MFNCSWQAICHRVDLKDHSGLIQTIKFPKFFDAEMWYTSFDPLKISSHRKEFREMIHPPTNMLDGAFWIMTAAWKKVKNLWPVKRERESGQAVHHGQLSVVNLWSIEREGEEEEGLNEGGWKGTKEWRVARIRTVGSPRAEINCVPLSSDLCAKYCYAGWWITILVATELGLRQLFAFCMCPNCLRMHNMYVLYVCIERMPYVPLHK